MKTRRIIFGFLTLCFFSSCSHKIYDTLDWQGNKAETAGKILEWSSPLRFYDEKSKINYNISNDDQNLYLCMNISDEAAKLKIIHGGMEFRIDTLGKKSFPIAFIFPIANQIVLARHARNELPPEKSHGEKPAHTAMDQKILNHAQEAQLIGFKPPLGETVSLSDPSSGISAAINIDSLGIMHYGAIIPFRTFYKNKLTNADANKVFSYEIKVNALPAPSMHDGASRGNHMGGGISGGGGGMGGGHHGGGGHSGAMGGGGHGSEHKSGETGYGSSDLYVSNQITKEMKFSFK